MKYSAYPQYATVKEDTGSLFDLRLNEKVYELRDYKPEVKFFESDPLQARITYIVTEQTPETVAEASAIEGVRFVCAQCPCFAPLLKDDGTPDKRAKRGGCDWEGHEFGITSRDLPACEHLFDLIKEGGVRLCFCE